MRRYFLIAAISVFAIAGCSQEAAGPGKQPETETWAGELPVREPWLREHLPEGSLVYARIPHPLGILATPKGSALDPALRSKANVENLEKIRAGYIENVLPLLPVLSEPLPRLLQQHLRSPIEISASFLPQPAGLIAANLDIASNDDFVAVLATAGLALTAPLDAAGIGQVDGAAMPLFVHFDAGSGRLLANVGPGVTAESFAALLARITGKQSHRMRSLESRIDTSGQGFFFWIDAKEAMSPMQMLVPREQFETLVDLGLEKVDAVAMGWGVANGKGRLSIVADMPTDAERGFLPYVKNDITARSAGNPDGLFLLSIPTVGEFARLEGLALAVAQEDSKAEWSEIKNAIVELSGVSLEDWLGSFGPELLFVFDRAGDYAAIRLRDAKLWDSVVQRVSEATGVFPDQRNIAGNTYFHWGLALPSEDMDASKLGDGAWIAELFVRQREHSYWMRDGDFIYVASTPQVLIDRAAMQPRTDIGDWLKEQQRIDAAHAWVSISGTTRKLPRRMYGFYLDMLHLLADLGQADIDMWSMPTAAQLALPETGSMGFTLSLGNPTVAAEFTFENNPAELMGGMGSVAVVGMLAAIAIPAYQDYTVRAHVASGLNAAAPLKAAVAEYYETHGRFPPAADAAAMSLNEPPAANVGSVVVEPDSGRIFINYRDLPVGPEAQVMLAPAAGPGGHISWSCEGTLDDKHLPAACRY